MNSYEEKVLIEVISDKDLDVLGVWKKRVKRVTPPITRINQTKRIINKLVSVYGKEGSIPYLTKLLNSTKGQENE